MTVYFVVKENGSMVCGPFRDMETAQEWAENYSGSPFWGRCHVIAKNVEP